MFHIFCADVHTTERLQTVETPAAPLMTLLSTKRYLNPRVNDKIIKVEDRYSEHLFGYRAPCSCIGLEHTTNFEVSGRIPQLHRLRV